MQVDSSASLLDALTSASSPASSVSNLDEESDADGCHCVQVGATAYNEGSSRSHTLIRLSVESSERPDPDADPRAAVARTLSFLNLIDLAGSESAKVCPSTVAVLFEPALHALCWHFCLLPGAHHRLPGHRIYGLAN